MLQLRHKYPLLSKLYKKEGVSSFLALYILLINHTENTPFMYFLFPRFMSSHIKKGYKLSRILYDVYMLPQIIVFKPDKMHKKLSNYTVTDFRYLLF